jgi:hypothetical protein
MAAIFLKSFQGERPRIDPRHLPNEFAQKAKGCHFYHGNLSPLRQLATTGDNVITNAKTIFRYLNEHWFAWNVDVDAVNSPIANDPWQRVYFTGDGFPKVTNNATFSGANMPAVSYRLGIQAPEIPVIGVVTEAATEEVDPNDDEDRYYTHTFVTEQGEEGPPGEASQKIVLLYPEEAETFVSLAFSPPNVNQANITRRRIYRTSTGGGVADYLLVADIPIAQAKFVDDIASAALGAPLETYDYERPPTDMFGLVSMANGIMAGFTGNTVCFSKAYLPYAWPTDYQMTTEHNIVGRIAMGNSIAVLTEGYPYIFSGVTPESMAGQKLESNQSCVSKRSAVIASGRIIYASPDGLVGLTSAGADVITDTIITKEQWQAFEPSTIEAYLQEGRYLAFYGANLDKCFIFDPTNGDFRTFDATATCGFNDLMSDSLYLCQDGFITKWEASAGFMSFTWHSKEYRLSDKSMAHVRVDGDDLDKVGIRIFCDKIEIAHKTPGQLTPLSFRLPTNRGDAWEFELYGTGTVKSVIISDSASDIKRLLNEAQ